MAIKSFRPLSRIPQSVHRHCAALAAAVLAIALAGHASAEDYLAPIGGPGGGQFQALCPSGQLLIGFDLRAADDVDAMRPVCATAYGPNVVGDVSQGNWHGGTGGRFHAAICPSDRPIVYGLSVDAEGVDTVIVNTIALDCGLAAETQPAKQDPNRSDAGFDGPSYMPAGPTRIWLGYGIGGGGKRATGLGDRQHCPMGQVAVGVHGRSGIWLDAIGLICGQPRVSQEHVPPPPPKKTLAEQRTTTSIAQSSTTAAASAGSPTSTTQASRSAAYGIVSAGMNARHGAAYMAQAQGNTMAKRNSRQPGANHAEATSNVIETSSGQGSYVEERATPTIHPSADVNAIAPTRSSRGELDAAVKREEENVAALREEMEQINDRSDFDKFMGGLFGSDVGAGEVGRKTERLDKPVYDERDQRSAPSVGTSPRYGASASSDETQAAMERANAEIVKMKEKTGRDQPGIDGLLGELQGEQSGLAAAKVTKTSLGNGLTVGDRFGKDGTKALLRNTTQTDLDASAQVHVEPPPTSTTYRPVAAAAALGGASPPSAASAPLPPIAAPAVVFSPPLLEDNAQLWACVDVAAGEAAGGACSGVESALAYCQLRGAQSGSVPVIATAQPEVPVRAVNGDVCPDAEACRVVSQLQCDH